MKKLNVCFRQDKNGKFKEDITCVFLDYNVSDGSKEVECYATIGQHHAGEYDYFKSDTKPTEEENYQALLKEIKSIYTDFKVVIHPNLTKKFFT